jgi:hypothetical protein
MYKDGGIIGQFAELAKVLKLDKKYIERGGRKGGEGERKGKKKEGKSEPQL